MINLFQKKKAADKNDTVIQWPSHVESLTSKTFQFFIESYSLAVIDFWAPWCKPCKTMLPRLRRLERLYHGKVAFGRINMQQEKQITEQYHIMGIPYFGFFHYGKKVGGATGVKSVGDMKELIETYLKKYD